MNRRLLAAGFESDAASESTIGNLPSAVHEMQDCCYRSKAFAYRANLGYRSKRHGVPAAPSDTNVGSPSTTSVLRSS